MTLALIACGSNDTTEPCGAGFGRAADGNCYPVSGDDDDSAPATGETGTSVAHSGTSCGTVTEPTVITSATVLCDSTADTVTFDVQTQGLTGGGYLYEIETGNAAPWSDETDLVSVEADPCGAWDHVSATIATGASFSAYEHDVNTLFTCESHYLQQGIMTYAAGVNDLDGNFADCLVWGDDPRAVKNATITGPNDPSFDTHQCVIGSAAR